jgi:hypothetical protein
MCELALAVGLFPLSATAYRGARLAVLIGPRVRRMLSAAPAT